MAKLVGKRGVAAGTSLVFDEGDVWTIGRDPDRADLIVEDSSVSREHAFVELADKTYTIKNLSETNPVLVNGQDIPEGHPLSEGDDVKIGDSFFAFTLLEEEPYETLFEAPEAGAPVVDLEKTAKWLIKVVAGPNTGAEFALQPGKSYLIGTDAMSCDIVFHDLSVSRQHARVTVGEDDTLMVEDLHSRNGVTVDGQQIEGTSPLKGKNVVATGTTSFAVIDREEAHETIFATAPPTPEEEALTPPPIEIETGEKKAKPVLSGGAFILMLVAVAIVVIAVAGTLSLFKSEDVAFEKRDYNGEIQQAVAHFGDVRFTFNPASGKLFLLGHVLTGVDKSEMLYNLQNLKFVRAIDDNVVVDQFVWEEHNSLLATNPMWRGASLHSPEAGKFVLSGYLQTQEQAASLQDYLRINFPYLDLLDNQIVVEDLLLKDVLSKLRSAGFGSVAAQFSNGELTLTGYIGQEEVRRFQKAIDQLGELRGIQFVQNFVVILREGSSVVDLTGRYTVGGYTKKEDATVNVLVNGQIVERGDILDGMEVINITSNTIVLEKNGVKYRIGYNQ